MKACFVLSGICFVLQVISWMGNAKHAASVGFAMTPSGVYGIGYMIGSNIMLIAAIVFLVIGLVLRARRQ